MSINPLVHRTANGMQLARRKMVLNGLASEEAVAFRRTYDKPTSVKGNVSSDDVDLTEFSAIALDNYQDSDVEYKQELGACKVLFSNYTGGTMAFSGEFAVNGDLARQAMIEPYNETFDDIQDRINNIPSWKPQRGDLVVLPVDEKHAICYEVVSVINTSKVGDFAEKYVLNYHHITGDSPILDEFNNREDS